jgi:hypothetical protein
MTFVSAGTGRPAWSGSVAEPRRRHERVAVDGVRGRHEHVPDAGAAEPRLDHSIRRHRRAVGAEVAGEVGLDGQPPHAGHGGGHDRQRHAQDRHRPAHDAGDQAVEAAAEDRLAPRHPRVGVEAARQGEERQDDPGRHQHHHGPDRRHDAEVVHRAHPAGDERAEADHVGGDGAQDGPEEHGQRRAERRGWLEPQGPLPAELHDHVRHRGDAHDHDHRREHRGDHRQLEAQHGQRAAGGPQRP